MSDPREYREVIDLLNGQDRAREMRKCHRLPQERYAQTGCTYCFTLCAGHHGKPFRDSGLAAAVVDSLLWRKQRHGWKLYCYCLMPDHLHFLIALLENVTALRNGGARGEVLAGVLEQVADFKSYTTSQLWWKRGGSGVLWQKSSYDNIVRYGGNLEHAVNYVLLNPVRRGLVEEWEQYPFVRTVDPWM